MKASAIALVTCVLILPAPAPAQSTCHADPARDFTVVLRRLGSDEVLDGGAKVGRVFGEISVNGETIGKFYENPEKMIVEGNYRGLLRYRSDHRFVQSSCGEMARDGDFLLEIADVKDATGKARTSILLHPGRLPRHSEGCVLVGQRKGDGKGGLLPLDEDSPLRKLRLRFYGVDAPVSCPDKRITVRVVEGPDT